MSHRRLVGTGLWLADTTKNQQNMKDLMKLDNRSKWRYIQECLANAAKSQTEDGRLYATLLRSSCFTNNQIKQICYMPKHTEVSFTMF